ncbi:MAG: YgjV family protein [Ardenticatenaceae bacterium]|nr:YgjV family protein [Anaerolineales bacterium]MCB8977937.1 YgjV family protein [Ardenticatenaceae bacterium]
MDAVLNFEMLGYLASLFVAISLMMRSLTKLRVINLVGSVLFIAYGLVIGAYPVAVMNTFILLVNLYHLQQSYRETAVTVTPQQA